MTTFTVKSAAELTAALSKSQDGDVIQLASGSYGKLVLKDTNIAGNVTITSADPANQAVINGLLVKNSSGLTFSGLDFHNPIDGLHNAFQLLGSKNIVLDNLQVHGPNNMGSGLEVALLMVRNTTNVTVSNSEFFNGWQAINMLDNNGLTISNNYIHDIRTDGVRGGGNSDLLITKNTFTDFFPNSIDHPDAIQLWTNYTTTSATNVTISDNLILRGEGAPMQGIFMRDIVGTLPFQNMNITGNIIAGGLYNGIAVEHVGSGTIANNIVAGFADQRSWIRADNSTNLTVTNNQATFYQSQMKAEQGVNGNTLISDSTDGGAALITKWLSNFSGFSSFWGGLDTKMLSDLGLAYDPSLGTTTPTTTTPVADTSTTTTAPATSTTPTESTTDTGTTTSPPPASVDTSTPTTSSENVISAPSPSPAGITSTGDAKDNRIIGTAGNDTISGMDGRDLLQGKDGDDIIYGGKGNDRLFGDAGNDTLFGDDGNDILYGGAGNDILHGGAGNDRIEGGPGDDVMTGGAGKDVFVFRSEGVHTNSADRITDFTRGQDKISLNLIDLPGKADFSFIGTSTFHKVVGELRYQVQNGGAYVEGDLNGDGLADFSIKLDNVTKLTASDFLL